MRMLISLVLALVVAAVVRPAWAHSSSVTYSTVEILDGGQVRYGLKVATLDLNEALALPPEHSTTDDEVRAGEARLFKHVLARVQVLGADDKACSVDQQQLTIGSEEPRIELAFVARCPAPAETITVSYDLFFELDPRHTGFLQVKHDGKSVIYEFTSQQRKFVWRADGAATGARMGLFGFVKKGMEHIFFGADHVAFVIALLLVAAIRWRDATWQPRSPRETVAIVLRVVTAFTIAHSITLIGAALDWIVLPGALVESAIAASVAYIAFENIFAKTPRYRWPFTFGFGLVHGLGFAAMLRPALPPSGVVVPLLAFNLGVELGQLAIVLVILPLFIFVAHRSASTYRQTVVVGGSCAIALMGVLWFIERAFSVAIF